MSWSLSRFRAGDLVEVRSQEEILATLDDDGCFGGMPFMPEMLQFCGQRIRVEAVAHKTCDTIKQVRGLRLQSSVHLAGIYCDGSAHGGCQAACNLFWKDEWLKPVNGDRNGHVKPSVGSPGPPLAGLTESRLLECTRVPGGADHEEPRYSCQATNLLDATEPLPRWDLRQYFYDVATRNNSLGRAARILFLAPLGWLVRKIPYGYRVARSVYDRTHRLLTGRDSPVVTGLLARGTPTPTCRLDLEPGELVRVKTKREIEGTLDENENNRGLSFGPEMTIYCGKTFVVRDRLTKIVDEKTGKMLQMKQPCITLEGVVCTSEYSQCRLLCPRAIPPYWREIWLERVEGGQS
jgi:hypothetical protein